MADFEPARGFGVYIHWPYCTRVCPYCDFNVYAAKLRRPDPLLDALCGDLRASRDMTGPRLVDTVFFGGGTPSLMSGEHITRVLECIRDLWGLKAGAEITLEANPDDFGRFQSFREAGVGRLSLGVQSLNDENLAFLGRTHSAKDALRALDVACSHFPSVSLDLIYALPGRTVRDWEAELSLALSLPVGHLSLYELTIEKGAAFARSVKRGDWTPPDEDLAADLYEATQRRCEDAGYPAYEISNHARKPSDVSRHNRIYWESGDWVGVGPGAHGRLTLGDERLAIETEENPVAYQKQVASRGHGRSVLQSLSRLDQIRERVSMGLRMTEGLRMDDLNALGFQPSEREITDLQELGFLDRVTDRIRLTLTGRLAADRISLLLSP